MHLATGGGRDPINGAGVPLTRRDWFGLLTFIQNESKGLLEGGLIFISQFMKA